MNFYRKDNIEVITLREDLLGFKKIELIDFKNDIIYYLYEDNSLYSLGELLVEDPSFLNNQVETLKGKLGLIDISSELDRLVSERKIIAINTFKIDFQEYIKLNNKKKSFKVNVLGLGDVGGIMLTGLRLLGDETISEMGIFDLDDNKIKRWIYELNQIQTIDKKKFPIVKALKFEEVFNCDVFIFTASVAIPEVGSKVKDVRMFQLEGNSKIISIYAKEAVKQGFKGQFIVVSDPVDLLCKSVLIHSEGKLLPEQIKGFGLGVMNARASYYGDLLGLDYNDGRAFGPHGKDLIIANNIYDYNQEKSLRLTDKTIKANLDVRDCGYKPFIAPALSSAALSILAYLNGLDHYSTVYVDGVYFGCKNKISNGKLNRIITEKNKIDEELMERLDKTYRELKAFEF